MLAASLTFGELIASLSGFNRESRISAPAFTIAIHSATQLGAAAWKLINHEYNHESAHMSHAV